MRTAPNLTLRPPTADDAGAISQLLGDLGYPATGEEAEAQLAAVQSMPSVFVLVAARADEIVGLITSHLFASIHSRTPVAWITTLVVSHGAQGTGVGSALLEEAERWARDKGAERVSLTSGIQRSAAHDFYVRRGYTNSGLRFTKPLMS